MNKRIGEIRVCTKKEFPRNLVQKSNALSVRDMFECLQKGRPLPLMNVSSDYGNCVNIETDVIRAQRLLDKFNSQKNVCVSKENCKSSAEERPEQSDAEPGPSPSE